MSTYFIDAGPLLPSLDHLIEYYCFYADGLSDTLSTAISPGTFMFPVICVFLLICSQRLLDGVVDALFPSGTTMNYQLIIMIRLSHVEHPHAHRLW